MDDDLFVELLDLETRLLRLGPRCPRPCIEALLALDFVEFGASGQVWTRSAILDQLENCGERPGDVQDVTFKRLCEEAVLLTYRIPGERESLRSSLWVKRRESWQMLFHQGTLVPPA